MTEFSNRIDAQRHILKIVNSAIDESEQLFSLSKKAIDRWCSSNQIDPTAEVVLFIVKASEKLFFLANKSQEQITNEYKSISIEIMNITKDIEFAANNKSLTRHSKQGLT